MVACKQHIKVSIHLTARVVVNYIKGRPSFSRAHVVSSYIKGKPSSSQHV